MLCMSIRPLLSPVCIFSMPHSVAERSQCAKPVHKALRSDGALIM